MKSLTVRFICNKDFHIIYDDLEKISEITEMHIGYKSDGKNTPYIMFPSHTNRYLDILKNYGYDIEILEDEI
jgi:hypothetical protein